MHTSHCSSGESRNHCKTPCETCSHHTQFHCSSSHGSCREKEDANDFNNIYNLSRRWGADSPVEIHEEETVNIDLPPLSWQMYSCTPKFLCVTNTGRTVLINGQWSHGRPFLRGGPLNGNYIFSQIHFHCPSEHQIGGVRYPLEMHVVHYKTSYLTQERAMHEKDGTVVLAYLFKVVNTSPTVLSNITNLAHELGKASSRKETKNVPLEQLVKPFTSNYYVYWGSVSTEKNSYLLQWIINCNCLYVTKEEVDSMLWIMSCGGSSVPCESKRMKPENNVVYRVGEDEVCMCNARTKSVNEFPKTVQVEEGKSCTHINSSRWTPKSSCRKLSLCSVTSKERRKKSMELKKSDTNTCNEATNTTPAVSTCHVNETSPEKVTCETQTDECICKDKDENKEGKNKNKEKEKEEHPEKEEAKEEKKDTTETPSEEKQTVKREPEETKKAKREQKKLDKKSTDKFKKSKSSKSLKEEKQKSATKANTEGEAEKKPSDVKIKTIFQKKGTKKSEKVEKPEKAEKAEKPETTEQLNSDVQVNFLLTPSNVHSISSVMRDSEMDKEDAENAEKQEPVKTATEVLVNTATNSRLELPSDKPKQQVKDLCLQMEHIFHSDNKEGNLSSYICQEYHVAIEYDNKVIQEYSGMFQPYNLLLGSSERLKVLSKYQDPKDLQVRLQDCTVKLESLDRLRVRTTFSVNESAFLAHLPSFKMGLGSKKEKKEKVKKTLDAETQCTIQEVIMNENLTVYKPFELGMRPPGELVSINQIIDRENTGKRDDDTVLNQKGKFEDTSFESRRKPEDDECNEERECFAFEREPIQKRECKMKLLKNPEIYKEDADSVSLDLPYQTDEAEEWKEQNIKEHSKSDMRLKHSLSKYKKTVYFMYDRIERDVNTGKKIFVGSFRTKEEIKNLSKQKKGFSNEKSYGSVEDPHKKRKENGPVIDGEISEEVVRIYAPSDEIKSEVEEPDESKSLDEKKGLVTLHKFRPKQPMNRNLIIGKVLNHLKEDTGKLVHLTGIIGVEKMNKTKIPLSELSGSGCENSNLEWVNFREDEKTEKENLKPQVEEGVKLEKTLEGKPASCILNELPPSKDMLTAPALEEEKSQKLLDTKDGQGAIIVIPVEVESLSKIELILIEHVEDVKKEKSSHEYIPCLNFYKRARWHH